MEPIKTISDILVNLTLITAAIASVLKFRLYRLYSRRYKTSFAGSHSAVAGGVLFEGDYVIQNTGERPIELDHVWISLYEAAEDDDGQLQPDEGKEIASRPVDCTKPEFEGLRRIEAGERSTFAMRLRRERLPDYFFVLCRFSWQHPREPSSYRSFYVLDEGKTFSADGDSAE